MLLNFQDHSTHAPEAAQGLLCACSVLRRMAAACGFLLVVEESINERTVMKSISKRREDTFKTESEETNNIVDKHLSKDSGQNITKVLRGKVRGKLKSTKVMLQPGQESPLDSLISNKITQKSLFNPQTEVLLDEGLSFFILSGEERSALSQSYEQRSVKDSDSKHFSLGDDLQNITESQDEDFMEEMIFTDLLEVKAAEYEDNQEQIENQQTNIFIPSSSPGNVLFQ
ncbi:protein CC2D2B homolog [Perognathus longimembris pacificus]|uniref:protein CC2D2B homolog n=1 Tax=Perognathus longimembris pacificus TaxID=214514 RepID=UPI002019F16F|nr:protein CC2D2B homolog [Perognathus longimembris pacificus]